VFVVLKPTLARAKDSPLLLNPLRRRYLPELTRRRVGDAGGCAAEPELGHATVESADSLPAASTAVT
jgi:hypothetical protein